MDQWYKLDNAAKLFPSVTSSKNTSVFRVSAVLAAPVDGFILQKAADTVISRYPMLFVRMRQGVFWNYLDRNREKFWVLEEQGYPCSAIHPIQNNGYFLKLMFSGNRVSAEIFHSLTDGSGAIEYLKSILYYYLLYSGYETADEGMVLLSDGYVPPDNMADSFSEYYREMKSELNNAPESHRLSGTPYDPAGNNVTTGVMSAAELNAAAKLKNATITSYLAATMIYSIYMTRSVYDRQLEPIIATIPVNLRKAFPSVTLRNFFGVVNVGMQVTRETSFEDILLSVTKQLREKTTREALQETISKNVKLEKALPAKLVPLGVKKPFVSAGFHLRGENKKTISISNLGSIVLPAEMARHVLHMEAVLYPTAKSPVNVGICSVNDRLTISFSRSVRENDLLRYFFRLLAERDGLEIAVYSNEWGEGNE